MGIKIEEKGPLKDHFDKDKRRHNEKKSILLLYQRVIDGPVIRIIHDEPNPTEDKIDNLETAAPDNQNRSRSGYPPRTWPP